MYYEMCAPKLYNIQDNLFTRAFVCHGKADYMVGLHRLEMMNSKVSYQIDFTRARLGFPQNY